MFEIPNSKRVRREELHSRSTSPDTNSIGFNVEAKLREHFEKSYFQPKDEDIDAEVPVKQGEDEEPGDEAVEFEFRLFFKQAAKASTATGGIDTATRVTIRSPSPINGESGFIQPQRPESYYFKYLLSEQEKQRLQASAVSGQDIISESQRSWKGNELPWRVTTLRITTDIPLADFAHTASRGMGLKRRRDGKKRRIAIRKRAALDKAKKIEASKSLQEKDAAEREKRTRRNREKKVKKKMREKEKKSEKLADNAEDLVA